MPRPRTLTQDRLVAAAHAVVDREGLAGLSMRAVAKELGMSTMGLYRYVADRETLERLLVESLLDAVDTAPPPDDTPWRERVEEMVRRLRVAVSARPAVLPLTVTHRHHSPGVLRWSETVLAILDEAGFDGTRRVIALRALLGYVIGALQLEHLGPLAGPGTTTIAALPPADFPHLADTARHARDVTPDAEFFGGLAILLRGLAS